MCLVQNSLEAVEASERSDSPITVSVEADEDLIDVIVEDEGCGMTQEVLQNVMTPFYTTRPRR